MLLRASYKFSVNIKKELVVFDDEEKLECLRLFNNIKSRICILPIRFYAINTIYITPKIILRTLKFLFLGNFNFSAYLAALVLEIRPKVLVTTIDHSNQFYNVSKILSNKVKCIAIQRANCDAIVFFPEKIKNKIYIPEFLSFGDYEKKLYKSINAKVLKFKPVGSYHYSNFESYYKKKIKIKYDLCLLAEIPYNKDAEGLEKTSEELYRGTLITKFAYKFAKKYRLKIVVAGKRPITKVRDKKRLENRSVSLKPDHKLEEETYKKIAGNKIKIVKNHPTTYSSYKTAYSSKVVIGGSSTLLREMLGAGKKVLAWRPDSKKGRNFPLDGICSLKSKSYQKFEERLKKIIKMNSRNYFKKINKEISYIMKYEKKKSAKEKILNIIEGYLNS